MKRCNDTLLKDTLVQILYPLEDYINQKYGGRKMSLWSNSEDQNIDRVQGRT
jgi:hypothetical protein